MNKKCHCCKGVLGSKSKFLKIGEKKESFCNDCYINITVLKGYKSLTTECAECGTKGKKLYLTLNRKLEEFSIVCKDCLNNKELPYDLIEFEDEVNNAYLSPEVVETSSETKISNKEKMLNPVQIVKELNKVVIGQDKAKRVLAVEIYSHYQKLLNENLADIKTKNNIMITGPSGSGKTYILENIAKLFNVPFTSIDITSFTSSGYQGRNLNEILINLLEASDFDVERAEQGIIFIDEIDKLKDSGTSNSANKDVSGRGVQEELLKIIEGAKVKVFSKGTGEVSIDTSKILFICAGAFDNIEAIVKNRCGISNKKVGFTQAQIKPIDENSLRKGIISEDLISFGLITEFVGRFSILCNLEHLGKENYINILKHKEGIIAEYKKLAKNQGKNLSVSEDFVEYVSESATQKKLGARSLRNIVAPFMNEKFFEMYSIKNKAIKLGKKDIEKYYEEQNICSL